MPAKVARKFREIALTEDCPINDLFLAAIDAYLTQQGHGGIKSVIETDNPHAATRRCALSRGAQKRRTIFSSRMSR
jgi:hypothetical protein